MEITVLIPDDLAQRLGIEGRDLSRRMLEALALEEFKLGHLTKPELCRLLGFETREGLDSFLNAHTLFWTLPTADLVHDRQALAEPVPDEKARARAREAADRIIARGKGVTLGGLKIKDLINEGRS